MIDYRVTDLALKSQSGQTRQAPSFEFAAAAFDSDSLMLNGIVNEAQPETPPLPPKPASPESSASASSSSVPVHATWIRIGVRDKLTNRMGTLEVQLPLAPEAPSPAVTSAR